MTRGKRKEPESFFTFELFMLIPPLVGCTGGVVIGIDFIVDPRNRVNPKQLAEDELAVGLVIILISLFWIALITLALIGRYRRIEREWKLYRAEETAAIRTEHPKASDDSQRH